MPMKRVPSNVKNCAARGRNEGLLGPELDPFARDLCAEMPSHRLTTYPG
jgi:hypothetical protein